MTTADVVVLLFGGRRLPRPLRGSAGDRPRRRHRLPQGRRRGIGRRSCRGADPVAARRPARCGGRPRSPTVAGPPGPHRRGATGSADPRRDRDRHRRRRVLAAARRAGARDPRRGGRRRHRAVRRRGDRGADRADADHAGPAGQRAVEPHAAEALGHGPRRAARHRCCAGGAGRRAGTDGRSGGRRSIGTPRAGCGSGERSCRP